MSRILVFILVSVTLILSPMLVYSDSGMMVIRGNTISYPGIPSQFALIYHSNGYELLMFFSKYKVSGENSSESIFYFPLPSKPLYYNILFLNNVSYEIHGEAVDLSHIYYRLQGIITAGGMGSSYNVLGTIATGRYNLSLVETEEISLEVFREVLAVKGYSGEVPDELREIIDHYRDLGWKYFVIGYTRLSGEVLAVQTYIFETDEIIYPLYLDRVQEGGIDLSVVMVADKNIEKIRDPYGRMVRVRLDDKGADPLINIWFSSKNRSALNDLDNFYRDLTESLNKYYGEEKISIECFTGDNSLGVRFKMKGIVYQYRKVFDSSGSIESDIIGYLSNTGDLTKELFLYGGVRVYRALSPDFFTLGLFLIPVLLVLVASSYGVRKKTLSLTLVLLAFILVYMFTLLDTSFRIGLIGSFSKYFQNLALIIWLISILIVLGFSHIVLTGVSIVETSGIGFKIVSSGFLTIYLSLILSLIYYPILVIAILLYTAYTFYELKRVKIARYRVIPYITGSSSMVLAVLALAMITGTWV